MREQPRDDERAALPPDSDLPQELSFDDDDEIPRGRAGDRRAADEIEREFSARREREAGITGGSIPGRDVTADDLSPQTLLDDDGVGEEGDDELLAADQTLREVGADEIGGGTGLDEEEQALLGRREIDPGTGDRAP